MSGVNKLLKNTLIFGVSSFASKLLVFILLPLYTRVMSTSDFGSGDLIISVITLIIPVLSLCVAEGALRFALSKNTDSKAVFTYGMIVILLGFSFLILLAPIIGKIPVINNLMVLFYLIYLSTSLDNYFNRFVRGINKIKLIGFVGVLSTFILVISNIVFLVVFRMGINGYLLSYFFMHFISMIVLFWKGKLYKYIDAKNINKELIAEINAFNIPLIPNRISWLIISTFNKYSVAFIWGTSMVGIFSAANKIPSFITALYGVIQQALLLVVIEEYEDNNESSTFSKTYQILGLILLLGVLAINSVIKPMAAFLFSESFFEAYKIAPLMVFAAYFGALHGNLTTYFSAIKNTKILFHNSIIGMTLMVILSILLVPKFGLIGAGIASATVYFLMWLRLFSKVKDVIHLDNKFSNEMICYLLLLIHWVILVNVESKSYYLFTILIVGIIIFIKRKLIKTIYSLIVTKYKEFANYLVRRNIK